MKLLITITMYNKMLLINKIISLVYQFVNNINISTSPFRLINDYGKMSQIYLIVSYILICYHR